MISRSKDGMRKTAANTEKVLRYVTLLLALTAIQGAIAAESDIAFRVKSDIKARVHQSGREVAAVLSNSNEILHYHVELITDTPIHLESGSYSFDGTKGFSIWYLDEGMSISTIHHVFVYSSGKKAFIELRPSCGDEFFNLKVDRKRKILLSTYYENNVPKQCVTRPTTDAN